MMKKGWIGAMLLAAGLSANTNEVKAENMQQAVFAGGCFWCMQPPFDQTHGVLKTEVGYLGGHVENPTYEQISTGITGHVEAIRIYYDAELVSYSDLLDVFWHNIDPTQADGQFADRGSQYKTVIFYANDDENKAAEASKAALSASGKFSQPIATSLQPLSIFYVGEDYHQQYYQKNSVHYNAYKRGSGRAGFIEKMWKSQAHGDQ